MKNTDISHAGKSAERSTPCQGNPSSHILVVDDDLTIRQLSAEVLAQFGYHVDEAEDGAAGWDALQVRNYDLLITDHKMPKLTGLELIKKLRSARMALPVIMVAGQLPTEELARDPSLQVAATLLKPFMIGELLGTVRTVLRARDGTRPEIYVPERAEAPTTVAWRA
jgi:DNA-binding response OmpR family regulator